jgi:RND family efflux transporter MFP subunit
MDHPAVDGDNHTTAATDGSGSATRKKSSRTIISIIVLALIFVGLVAFGGLPRFFQHEILVQHTKKQLSDTMSVSVTLAQPGSAVEQFTLPGSTEAIQDAPIYARVNGYLHKRYVSIGDKVKAGQILADIEVPEIDQQVAAAESGVIQAEAALVNAQEALKRADFGAVTAAANVRKGRTDMQFYTAEVGRYTQLATEGAVSMETRDAQIQAYHGGKAVLDSLHGAESGAQAAVKSAKAAVNQADAALNMAKANLSQVEATRSFRNVTALFDGVVTKRNVDAGALITSGSNNSNAVLFEIAKTDILRVFVYVPEQYVPFIHEKQEAFLEFQEYPGKNFVGTVTNVSGGLDPTSKTLQVEIHVPNDQHLLMPGEYAKVHFQAPSAVRLAVVPATVLQTRADGAYVYTVDAQNRVHMNKLEIGRDLGGHLEVFKGVKTGDKVIVNPPDDVRDGMLVVPVMAPTRKDTST